MELISVLVWAALAALPLAVATGWLIGRGERELGALLQGRDTWWRSTMPWPRGVQEDDEVHWRLRRTGSREADPRDDPEGESSVERLNPEIRVRDR
jgi:hypothetical protein